MATLSAAEARLNQLREEAREKGRVDAPGIRPPGSPFPAATPETGYYGLPLLQEPVWKWEVPAYFFVGGAAGAAAVIAAASRARGGDPTLARDARWIAAAGGPLSAALLTLDLGRPERFLNMLRVFKLQSPMSVGAWTLATFSTAAAATAFARLMERDNSRGPVAVVGNAAEILSAATGLVMSSYTGVLIGATAIPAWSKNVRLLPGHFAASALGSAVGLLELAGHRHAGLRSLGIAASLAETFIGTALEIDRDPALDPLKHGRSGWMARAGGVLSGPVPLVLRIGAWRSDRAQRAAALAALIGSLLTRVGWISAGTASARDSATPLELAPAPAIAL
jgi:formate-dependent nitrite reductase membrane component NrfD